MAVAREADRAHRRAVAEQRRQLREAAAAERSAAAEARRGEIHQRRTAAQADKEAKRRYLEEREAEAAAMNAELSAQIDALQGVLIHTLSVNDTIAFDSLRLRIAPPRFSPPADIRDPAPRPCIEAFTSAVKKPSTLGAMIPGARRKYEESLASAEAAFAQATAGWERQEETRKERLLALHKEHEASKAAIKKKVEARDQEVEELHRAYIAGEAESIVTYNSMVLERSEYPEEFPQEFNLAYVPESKQLVIEYELPPPSIVPSVLECKYQKAKDEIVEKPRKPAEIKALYQDMVASIALRTLHEIFEADQGSHVDCICLNGFVQTVDPATGKDVRPHLISVRTTKEAFSQVDLARVDKLVCLRNLGAQVSPRPSEAQPIKPIVEFDMVDKRFVEQSDVLSDLESRPNLMDLNPFEFEHLVANLFGQMGLESKLTRSSRDGGVDCVAFDPRPVLGGKVVIQAKRYRNTVGVSAVRDLYGTMINEGANKGILVSTSGYGPDAFEFCKDKPIELVDGGGLLYLLQQNGVKARIIFPAE
jgi:restriction system protein